MLSISCEALKSGAVFRHRFYLLLDKVAMRTYFHLHRW